MFMKHMLPTDVRGGGGGGGVGVDVNGDVKFL